MRALWLAAVCLALAACTATPTSTGSGGSKAQRPENYRAKVHTELAAQYYTVGNYAVSLQELRIALEADAAYPPAYNMLGLVHAALGEDREAEENFRKSIRLSGNYSDAYNNYGYFLCLHGRYGEALTQFDAALANPLYSSPEKALANAGYCALLKGDLDGSEKYLRRALARAPNQRLALQGQAELQLRRNNPYGARASLDRLKAQGDLDALGLWLALRVERQLGNKAAEAGYAVQLRERYPEARETRWLQNGQYEMVGGLL